MNYLIYFGSDIILYYDILKKKKKKKKKEEKKKRKDNLNRESVNVFKTLLNEKSENVRLCPSFSSSIIVNLSEILPCGVQILYLWFVIQL